mmetsp:Transcript_8118/g.15717  ORF Transcript_8118/g.15717 Transcript_8118/m.15717 type:complete len:95 (-) Transcript_8118:846-1130(-)
MAQALAPTWATTIATTPPRICTPPHTLCSAVTSTLVNFGMAGHYSVVRLSATGPHPEIKKIEKKTKRENGQTTTPSPVHRVHTDLMGHKNHQDE